MSEIKALFAAVTIALLAGCSAFVEIPCGPPAEATATGSSSGFLKQDDADDHARNLAHDNCKDRLDGLSTDVLVEYVFAEHGTKGQAVDALERRRATDPMARSALERREREAAERIERITAERRKFEKERSEREAAEYRRREDLSGTLTGLAAAMQRMEQAAAATDQISDDIGSIDCGLSENFELEACRP